MKIWEAYTAKINRNCAGPDTLKDLSYWRNNLFASTIIFVLPLCLIALVPGLYYCWINQLYLLGSVDILISIIILIIAFMPGIELFLRKIIFLTLVIILGSMTLLTMGLASPGLLYLLAACILSLLIFPKAYSYWPAWIITGICLLIALCIYFGIISLPILAMSSGAGWVAVSSNLVFLVFLLAALIPRLFKGLQETLNKEIELKNALRKQQEVLEQALQLVELKNKELEQFAYVASHDLQEPLRMVTSFMALLQNQYGQLLDEKALSYVNFAVDGGKRMQAMIKDLLLLSQAGRQDAPKDTVALADILTEVQQNIFKLVDERQAAIIVETALPVLPVYRGDMCRLFQNLLSNAIKFQQGDNAPIVVISCKEEEQRWLISVTDNGIGISKDKSEKIFEIFSRLHGPESYQGSGIGLAVCKKIAEQHGGSIWVVSEEGKGSTFYFTIQK